MTTYLAYLDESGDDGFPKYSSEIFVLSAFYLPAVEWRAAFERLLAFRRQAKLAFGFPVKLEFHTRQFLLNKNPYRELGLTDDQRIGLISRYCDVVATLPLRAINVGIVKPRIKHAAYDVLDWAVKLGVQRVENDLRRRGDANFRFVLITDEGRVGKMTRTTRRLQRFNPISSKLRRGMVGTTSTDPEYRRLPRPSFWHQGSSHMTQKTSGGREATRRTPPTTPSRFQWFASKLTSFGHVCHAKHARPKRCRALVERVVWCHLPVTEARSE